MHKHLLGSSVLVALPLAAMAQQPMQSGSADGLQYQYLVSPGGCSAAAPCQIIEYLHFLGGESYVPDDLNTYFNTPAFWAAHPSTVVVAPQVNGSSDTNNWGGVQPGVSPNGQAAVAAVQQIETQIPTNPNSVVLTGGSMGGIGTEALMEEYGPKGTTGQHVYAAGVAYDGAIYNSDPATEKAALCGVPLIVQHGSADTTVLPTYDEQLAQTLSGCAGFQYVELPGAVHGTWGDSYTALTQLSEMTAAAAASSPAATPAVSTANASTAQPKASAAPSGASSAAPNASTASSTAFATASTASTPMSTASPSAAQDVQIADDAIKLIEAESASPSPNTQLIASLLTEAGSRLDAAQTALGSPASTTPAPIASNTPSAPTANTSHTGSGSGNATSTHASTNTPAAATSTPNAAVPAVSATACDLASSGQFSAMGNTIYGPNQTPFVARGINIMEGQEPSLAEVQSAFPGINFIRYAIYDYADPATLAAYINQFTNAGIVVELEDHANSDGSDAGGQSGQVFTGQQLTNELAWYSSIATAFKNNPYVWFGTDNEPAISPSVDALSGWQEATYNAVRQTGNNAPIMLETIITGGDASSVNQGMTQSDYSNMTNTIWDMHYYGWVVNMSTDQSTIDQSIATGAAAAQKITNAGGVMPVIIGEYGDSTTGASIDPNGMQVVAGVDSSGMGSAAWAWGSGNPGDGLTNGSTPTSPYGQQVASFIASGGTTTGTSSLAQTCGTAISSTAAPTATAVAGATMVPQNSLSSISAPAGMN